MERLAHKEQIILFLNRRGYAGFVSCRSCGEAIGCPHCSVALKAHKSYGQTKLVCHYCGHTVPMPKVCPKCGSPFISTFGIGTQQVEQMVRDMFPQARVLRMDQDTAKGKDGHEQILSAFANREADILIGTQMIVKGHDFPDVTLVGILAADLSLYGSDYMAAERTFDLLTQAAGRAGRGEKKGQVIIQTYKPEDYSIQTAAAQDYEAFYEAEMAHRRLAKYPPAWKLAAVLFTAEDELTAKKGAMYIKERLQGVEGLQLVGPTEGSVFKIADVFRFVLYLRAREDTIIENAKEIIETEIISSQIFKSIGVQFDYAPIVSY
jgi:primosomal protein N' (replication factor Y)